jgi:hypothetical protein
MRHLTAAELESGLDEIRRAPKDDGILKLIVRRPKENEREVLDEGELDINVGLVGDNWRTRGSSSMPDRSSNPEKQLNIMNARAAALVAQDEDRRKLAGDQLFIDLDLSDENLPAGTRLKIGLAVIEITPPPHNGCKKFVARFGLEAMKFVNSPVGKELHLRGVCAKVVVSGVIKQGDKVKKVEAFL